MGMTTAQSKHRNLAFLLAGMIVINLLVSYSPPSTAQANAPNQTPTLAVNLKPYKVLVVAGVQMKDSLVIHDALDFGDVIGLLKIWGVPFDILRLESHTLELDDFIDGSGQAKYGTIIWTAQQDQYPWQPQDYNILTQAVNDYHISLIALANKIQEPIIQGLLGVNFIGWTPIADPVIISSNSHFITRPLAGASIPAAEAFPNGNGAAVSIASPGVETLAQAGDSPQLTVKTIDAPSRTTAIWIGGQPDMIYRTSPSFIHLLQRCLVFANGYVIYKDYDKSVILAMDDPGSAQTAYLNSWHYPQLSQGTIQTSIIIPLLAHNARLGVNFTPGYPWLPTQTITRSVWIDQIDPFGIRQNIVSTAAGLRDGVAAGVLEIHSHGLTHMVPDLDTPIPGSTNWWNGSPAIEWPITGWYREFFDTRRQQEVDAATQMARLVQSADWITQDFGVKPLTFTAGNYSISGERFESDPFGIIAPGGIYTPTHIADNYTYKLAARAGYGLSLENYLHYLGQDYVISLHACTRNDLQSNFDRGVPAFYTFHDRAIASNPSYLSDMLDSFEQLYNVTYLSMDEWTGYLHTQIGVQSPVPQSFEITFSYDKDYCRYFAQQPSSWTLHLSDELLVDFQNLGQVEIYVDGQLTYLVDSGSYFCETQTLSVPVGEGVHSILFLPRHVNPPGQSWLYFPIVNK
jgi:hypothetical protein